MFILAVAFPNLSFHLRKIDYGLWCCMQSMVGDASDKKFLKKALRGVRTIICPNVCISESFLLIYEFHFIG